MLLKEELSHDERGKKFCKNMVAIHKGQTSNSLNAPIKFTSFVKCFKKVYSKKKEQIMTKKSHFQVCLKTF